MSARVFGFVTATAVWPHDDEVEERSGWVDPQWSRTDLHDSRNDVRPVVDAPDFTDNMVEEVVAALKEWGPSFDSDDGSTLYSVNEVTDYSTGAGFTYALHFVRKTFDSERGGWVEEPWPVPLQLRMAAEGSVTEPVWNYALKDADGQGYGVFASRSDAAEEAARINLSVFTIEGTLDLVNEGNNDEPTEPPLDVLNEGYRP